MSYWPSLVQLSAAKTVSKEASAAVAAATVLTGLIPDAAGELKWLITTAQSLHPLARQLVIAKKMSVIDSARLMALASIAAADVYVAVMEAKYFYEFWRPITAIRNGDTDDNPATERDPARQPLGTTPMHSEYPCAHCIYSAALPR
jgi:hypothetical protein